MVYRHILQKAGINYIYSKCSQNAIEVDSSLRMCPLGFESTNTLSKLQSSLIVLILQSIEASDSEVFLVMNAV